MKQAIQFKQVNNDVNGNSRYVCHFTNLLTQQDREELPLSDSPTFKVIDNIAARYNRALQRAKKIGGRKFHNKQYGGGIVFAGLNPQQIAQRIEEITTSNK